MSAAREKLLKRKPMPIGENGDGLYVQALTIRETIEAERLGKIPEGHQAFAEFILSRAVVDEKGVKIFEDEKDEAILDVPTDKLADVIDAVTKRSKVGSLKATEKNSDATP